MNILHVIVNLESEGAQTAMKRLVLSHTNSPRYRHSAVSLSGSGPVGAELEATGVRVDALGMRSAIGIVRTMSALRKVIRSTRPDVVQTWMYHADLLGGLAAKSEGIDSIIWGIRTTDIIRGTSRKTALLRHVCAALSRRIPARIVCVAESARRTHIASGYASDRMLVIGNGFEPAKVDGEARRSVRRELGWQDDDIVVGTVGRFNHYKDYRTFVAACDIASREEPRLRVIMIGGGLDASNSELNSWIRPTKKPSIFALLGQQKNVRRFLSAMDMFCLSSRSEGFPNAVGEAMALGIPCVVTDVGDSANLVGDTGLVVPPENPVALGQALSGFASLSSEQRCDAGRRARDRIATQFSMDRIRAQYETLYELLYDASRTRDTAA